MSRWLRRLGILLGCVVGLVVLLAGFVWVKSSSALAATYSAPSEKLTLVADSAAIARGEHLVLAIGKCADCHGDDLGGKVFVDDPALGRVTGLNLTTGKGGVGAQLTDAQIETTIRHGVKPDGHSVMIMPSEQYQYFTDADVGALIAYIRSRPPVDRELAPTELRAVGRALLATGQLPVLKAAEVDNKRPHPATIAMDTSLAYGTYLANVGGCTGCHGPGLSGGKIPGVPPDVPPAANLTPKGIGHYTDAQVETILRTGKRPDGSSVNDFMPWRRTALMTADEIATTIKYLRTVPPKEFGGR